MATDDITVTIQDAEVQSMLMQLAEALTEANLDDVMGPDGEMVRHLRLRARQRFANEGDDVTGKWLPLSLATEHIREVMGYPRGPINRRTGQMEDWLTGARGMESGFAEFLELEWPDNAPAHIAERIQTAQQGSKDPPTPPRLVIGVDELDLAALMAMLEQVIYREVGRFSYTGAVDAA